MPRATRAGVNRPKKKSLTGMSKRVIKTSRNHLELQKNYKSPILLMSICGINCLRLRSTQTKVQSFFKNSLNFARIITAHYKSSETRCRSILRPSTRISRLISRTKSRSLTTIYLPSIKKPVSQAGTLNYKVNLKNQRTMIKTIRKLQTSNSTRWLNL